ncbi:ribonuclease HII [Frigidibacter sp. MR17.24]|uniref:ribonuclease HII n=1 Tax=Frigidibacter sp. MR17.24 TaxID=3127345 RepID=UPI003012FDAD
MSDPTPPLAPRRRRAPTVPAPQQRPDYRHESEAFAFGARLVAGCDEVGRGPLCGPVVAAAVILDPARIPEGLNDSKKLSALQRARIEAQILESARCGIGEASVAEIDEVNILRAAHLAMCRAVASLEIAPDLVLIDGNMVPRGFPVRGQPLVKGDQRSVSIAAASIVAKQHRDRIMVELAQQHPGYGWDHNAGYPTREHLKALLDLGATPHHRRSFRPVHNILYQDVSITR